MTKKETAVRQEFKKLVIMGNHPGLSYEKALRKELRAGCWILDKEQNYWLLGLSAQGGQHWITSEGIDDHPGVMRLDHIGGDFKIIGLPITIGRVFNALVNYTIEKYGQDDIYWFDGRRIRMVINHELFLDPPEINWSITNKGKELCDNDQNIETITKLLELLKSCQIKLFGIGGS